MLVHLGVYGFVVKMVIFVSILAEELIYAWMKRLHMGVIQQFKSSMLGEAIREALDGLALEVHTFERDLAYEAGILRTATSSRGLSLED